MSSSHHLHSHTMFDQPTECHWEPSWHCQQVPRPSLHRKGSRARKLRAPSPAARQLLPVLHLQCLLGAQPHLGFLTAYAALVHQYKLSLLARNPGTSSAPSSSMQTALSPSCWALQPQARRLHEALHTPWGPRCSPETTLTHLCPGSPLGVFLLSLLQRPPALWNIVR